MSSNFAASLATEYCSWAHHMLKVTPKSENVQNEQNLQKRPKALVFTLGGNLRESCFARISGICFAAKQSNLRNLQSFPPLRTIAWNCTCSKLMETPKTLVLTLGWNLRESYSVRNIKHFLQQNSAIEKTCNRIHH